MAFEQNLWETCNPNPDNCNAQLGTWTFSRAGWCPGAIAPPSVWNLTPYLASSVDLHYRFDPSYIDRCHPNSASCINNLTCPDCNDTFNPSYEVDGHVVNFSNTPLLFTPITSSVDNHHISNYKFQVYPNPVHDKFNLYADDIISDFKVLIYTIDGLGVKTYYFDSNEQLNDYQFDVSNLSSGTYYISIENQFGSGATQLVIQK